MKVIDANVIAYLLIEGRYTDKAKQLLKKDPEWIAPLLWRSEYRNVLATYVRNKYFDLSQALFLVKKAEELMQGGEYQVQSKDVLELAKESGCSAYDCEYVALAKDLGAKLITTDKQLIKAFPNITINLSDITI
ncbi:PIN domain-containing protein [candidate division KSB1 bacterium]|nr:PIN domain-containing protein [candidate division KSB1 bacterium]